MHLSNRWSWDKKLNSFSVQTGIINLEKSYNLSLNFKFSIVCSFIKSSNWINVYFLLYVIKLNFKERKVAKLKEWMNKIIFQRLEASKESRVCWILQVIIWRQYLPIQVVMAGRRAGSFTTHEKSSNFENKDWTNLT